MRQIKSAGECPQCQGELIIYKTKSYGRFIKCDEDDCDLSYPVPRSGSIELSGLYCPELKLAVELDGESHNNPEQREYDIKRQKYL